MFFFFELYFSICKYQSRVNYTCILPVATVTFVLCLTSFLDCRPLDSKNHLLNIFVFPEAFSCGRLLIVLQYPPLLSALLPF